MGPIVCATRGGEASHRTRERAVALAKERDSDLIFLCVVDPSFAGDLDDWLAAAMEDELRRLGRSLLHIAQARAKSQGVDAQTVCISGPVWENIGNYLRKVKASALVIGLPKSVGTLDAFGSGDAAEVVDSLQRSTGIEVVVVT